MSTFRTISRGFTLVELLITISIIALLATAVSTQANLARARSRDADRKGAFNQISTSLNLFYNYKGRMPANYTHCAPPNQTSFCGATENDHPGWNDSMGEMVTLGILKAVPHSAKPSSMYRFAYFNYPTFTIIQTFLETAPPSTGGVPPSVRPWPAGTNWCSKALSTEYCLQNKYL